jgi:hypothetical protein
MSRPSLGFLTFAMLLACSSSVVASESDQDSLRKELVELKAMAAELQARIAAIEQKLKPKVAGRELRINDVVVVDIAVTTQGNDRPRTAAQSTSEAPLLRHFHATIVDIHPNGDAVLSAHRDLTADNVRYRETLDGVVPRDQVNQYRHLPVEAIRDLTMSRRAVAINK